MEFTDSDFKSFIDCDEVMLYLPQWVHNKNGFILLLKKYPKENLLDFLQRPSILDILKTHVSNDDDLNIVCNAMSEKRRAILSAFFLKQDLLAKWAEEMADHPISPPEDSVIYTDRFFNHENC